MFHLYCALRKSNQTNKQRHKDKTKIKQTIKQTVYQAKFHWHHISRGTADHSLADAQCWHGPRSLHGHRAPAHVDTHGPYVWHRGPSSSRAAQCEQTNRELKEQSKWRKWSGTEPDPRPADTDHACIRGQRKFWSRATSDQPAKRPLKEYKERQVQRTDIQHA